MANPRPRHQPPATPVATVITISSETLSVRSGCESSPLCPQRARCSPQPCKTHRRHAHELLAVLNVLRSDVCVDHKFSSSHELLNPGLFDSEMRQFTCDEIPMATALSLRTIACTGHPQLVEKNCVCNETRRCSLQGVELCPHPSWPAITVWEHETLPRQRFSHLLQHRCCLICVSRDLRTSCTRPPRPGTQKNVLQHWACPPTYLRGLPKPRLRDLQSLCNRAHHRLRAELQIDPVHADENDEPGWPR